MVFNCVTEDGKPRPKWETTKLIERNNKTNAKKMLTEELARYNSMTPALSHIAFVELILMWLEQNKRQVRGNSSEAYRSVVELHVIPYFEKMGLRVHEVTSQIVRKYYNDKHQEGLGSGTIAKHRTVIHSSLQYATEILGIIPSNPAKGVTLPKEPDKAIPNFYSAEEIRCLFEAVKGESIEPAVRLAGTYGFCREEVCGLEWSAVDFQSKTIQIRKTAVRVGTAVEYEDNVKEVARFRTMPLTSEMEKYLLGLKAHQQKMKEYLGAAYQDNDLICKWDDGKPLAPDYITQRFRHFLKKQGLRHITFHQLRHSSASILVSNGHSLEEVQAWLGHKSRKSTEIYAHFQAGPKLSMASTIDTLLSAEKQPDNSANIFSKKKSKKSA